MNSRIRRHLDSVFSGFEDTQRLRDFKEELAANLAEKIADLRASGLDEDTAFREAIASLGDIRAVYAQGEEDPRPASVPETGKKWRTSFNPVAEMSFNPMAKKEHKGKREGSGLSWGLFLIAIAVYLYFGLNNIAGGFGSWWMVTLFFYGVYCLLRGGLGCGTVLVAAAVLMYTGTKRSYLVLLGILGFVMVVASLIKKGRGA